MLALLLNLEKKITLKKEIDYTLHIVYLAMVLKTDGHEGGPCHEVQANQGKLVTPPLAGALNYHMNTCYMAQSKTTHL